MCVVPDRVRTDSGRLVTTSATLTIMHSCCKFYLIAITSVSMDAV
jgi:hypothetical protein